MRNTNGHTSLRRHVKALAQRECGVAYAEVTGYATSQVTQALWRLKTEGEVFAAKLSHKSVRYFGTPEAAQAFERANRKTAASNGTAASYSGRHIGAAGRHQRAWWPADAPMVITEKTKVIKAPAPAEPTKTNTHTEWGG